jgi:PAS domain S-box-containing protein
MLELIELHQSRVSQQFSAATILPRETSQKLLNILLLAVTLVMFARLGGRWLNLDPWLFKFTVPIEQAMGVATGTLIIFLINRYGPYPVAAALFLGLLILMAALAYPGGLLLQDYHYLLFALPIILSSILLSSRKTHFVLAACLALIFIAAWPRLASALPAALILFGLTFLNYQIDRGWQSVIQQFYLSNQRLSESEARYRSLLSAIASILIGLDEQGRIIQWNSPAERVFGKPAAQVLSQLLVDCGLDWDQAKIVAGVTQCHTTFDRVRLDRVAYRRPDGKWGLLGLVLNPILSEDRRYTGVLIVGSDITERLQLETQLAQAQKLKSIGQLAAGIAHEINTPIQYIGDNTRFMRDGFTSLIRMRQKYGEFFEAARQGGVSAELVEEVKAMAREVDLDYLLQEIPQAVAQSLEGIDRVSKIVAAMKEFSHPGGENKQAIDLNHAIENTVTVARNEWKYVATLETDFDPELPLVPCLPSELNQVILNLIVNAAHAIGEKAEAHDDSKGLITLSTRQQADCVEVRVKDTGTGIPADIQDRIFDPFFTTKEVGKGTGQGLAIAHDVVVEKHGGTLTFETDLGHGTTFIIRLPLAETAASFPTD